MFLAAFAIIALLARATALGTSAPWFSAGLSMVVYAATIISATILIAALAALGSSQVATADRELSDLDLRIAVLRGRGLGGLPGGGAFNPDQDIDDTLDAILGAADGGTSRPLLAVAPEGHDSLVPASVLARTHQENVVKELSRLRNMLLRAGFRVRGAVLGPIAMGLVFLSIAGAMLPGSDAFAALHFQMNTALILFLGYGWPFLVAWSAVGLALARPHDHTSV